MATKDITDRVNPNLPSKKVPQQSIFEKVKLDPRYTQARSIDWFKKKITDLGGNSPSAKYDLLKTTKEKQSTIFLPGAMYIFKYDPKHKETLPFYDTWPCSLIFSIEGQLVRGLNIHYLGYALRIRLMDKLLMIANKFHNDKQQCNRITWKFLSNVAKFPEVAPCVKSYLYTHIQSRLIKVDVDDWIIAAHLPFESFAKKSFAYVARNSTMFIKNRK